MVKLSSGGAFNFGSADSLKLDDLTPEGLRGLVQLLDESNVLLFAFDEKDRLRISNSAFRRAMFIEDGENITWCEMLRRNHADKRGARIDTDDFEAWLSSAISRRAKVPHRKFEVDHWDGRWFSMTETVLKNGWMFCVASDVTYLRPDERDLRRDRDEAVKAAQTDELTGVSNRRHIMEQLDAMRNGKSASGHIGGHACLMDIDHFKSINDQHGHLVGDIVLQSFAQCVRRTLGVQDSFGRVGGEEFFVLMPTLSEDAAQARIEKIFNEVRALLPVEDTPDVRVTVSAGMCKFDDSGTASTIYQKCDDALYRAKRGGRDQIQWAGKGLENGSNTMLF